MENVFLDFTGGVFSFSQLVINTVGLGEPLFGNNSGDQGFNIVKFLLSILSIIFDCIFFFQHFVLYRKSWATDKAQDQRLEKLSVVS